MYYVYEWFIKETEEIIYVGKGINRRYKVTKHNNFFNEMIKRYNCDSRIVKHFETEKEAFEYEYEYIKKLKSKNQCVCNIYNGGTGGTTEWWTDEKKEWYSKNNCMKNEKQRLRMSINNPMKNEKTRNKVKEKKSKKIVLGDKTYNSIKEIAKEFQIRDTAVQYWLKRGYGRNQELCYYYGEKPGKIVIRTHETSNKPVLIDGIWFKNVKSGANYIGACSESLIRAIKKNKLCKGHKCEYANQQPSHENSDKSIVEGSTTNE